MPYIEQYTVMGATTTDTYFLVSEFNTYYKIAKDTIYNEILTAAGSLFISLGQVTDVDVTTTAPVIGDMLKFDGTDWVNRKLNVVNKTSDYTATLADDVITVDTSAGTRTITLPTAASSTGHCYWVYKMNAANTLTVDGNGAELINGSATLSTTTQYACLKVISNGTGWVASTL